MLIFGWCFEVAAWSRLWRLNLIKISWELVIWPKEVTLVSRTQPSGPLCLWQCLQIDTARTKVRFFRHTKYLQLRFPGTVSNLRPVSIFLLKRKLLSVYLGSLCLSVFVSICVSPCASVASSSLDSVSSVSWPGVCAGLVMAANKWKWKTHLHFQCTFPQFPQFHSSSR